MRSGSEFFVFKKLQIVNYKNLHRACFEFDKGVNTIIGENDSGKSNALRALRILLDDTYYYNAKQLKESDFCDSLDDWRGHWIIISALFAGITKDEEQKEGCKVIIPDSTIDKEGHAFFSHLTRCRDESCGTITLLIRPDKTVRKRMSQAKNAEEFDSIRKNIKLKDYVFEFRARSQIDFMDEKEYVKLVGDFNAKKCPDPDQEDTLYVGGRVDITDVYKYISVSFIRALRDVKGELDKSRNLLKRIFDSIRDKISSDTESVVLEKINDLNETLSDIQEVGIIKDDINEKLQDIVGLIYSPSVVIESRIRSDISSIARYLSVRPEDKENIDLLGLGHLNILYIALKLVEFDVNRHHEILNIMLIEEPEAHIHAHIQRTIFNKLAIAPEYTQILLTTHSTQISDVANIHNMNVLKIVGKESVAMRPDKNLNKFGCEYLNMKGLDLSRCLERYLDAKRSILLFSKSVILVEGDAEEILIPAIVKKCLGVTLDELGIGLINIGSVAFEYIASVFAEQRIQKRCAIVTDLDAVIEGSSLCSDNASKIGISRKNKLEKLYSDNRWVQAFFAPHTFEFDFAKAGKNMDYIKQVVEIYFLQPKTIKKYKDGLLGNDADSYDAVLELAKYMGKGWMATILVDIIDENVAIPTYISQALAFASKEVMTLSLKTKIISYREKDKNLLDEQNFRKQYPDDSITKFFIDLDRV